jgi:4-aminobutyrate aminotransferase-like enzyme
MQVQQVAKLICGSSFFGNCRKRPATGKTPLHRDPCQNSEHPVPIIRNYQSVTLSLLEKERQYCSQGDTSGRRSPKKAFARAEGEWLIDFEGRRYIDLQMCNSAANFGYGSPAHMAALKTQAEVLPSLAAEFIHEKRVSLAEQICLANEGRFGVKGRVHFSVGGAQAVEDALKLIARLTGSMRVFAFEGSYHGRTLAASRISAAYRYRAAFGTTALAEFVPFPYCNRCPFEQEPITCNYRCISQFARLFQGEAAGQNDGDGNPECRAFIVEPVLGRGGYIPAPPDYFHRLKQVLDTHRMLLVADEIQMGFFRAGKLWSIENYGVVPDIIIFGKALTNGMFPLSGLWAREPLLDPSHWPVGSSHATFGAAPLGSALGLATLEMCSGNEWSVRAEKIGQALEYICRRIAARHPQIRHINRMGAALSMDIGGTDGIPNPQLAHAIVEDALQGNIEIAGQRWGLVATTGGGHGNLIMLAPPLIMQSSSLELVETLLNVVFARVTNLSTGASDRATA